MAKNFVIAIDGPSAAGKGTLGRSLARHYHFAHLDTGALYRAVAYGLEIGTLDPTEMHALAIARKLDPSWLDRIELRTEKIGEVASRISAFPEVRQALMAWQREFAHQPPGGLKGAILDGRDIGTVICPDAAVKFFVTARPEVRAQRRCQELQERGEKAIYAQILLDIQARDRRDAERVTAPLKAAKDAIVLDTSDMGAERVLEKARAWIDQKMAQQN